MDAIALIGEAWECFKVDWTVLVGAMFIGGMIYVLPSFVLGFVIGIAGAARHADMQALQAVSQVIGGVLGLIAGALVPPGWIAVSVASARRQSPTIGTMFEGMRRALPYFFTSIVVGLAVLFGAMLCIVPGVILFLALSMAQYFVTDGRLGPIEAIKASWQATRSHWLQLLVLFLLSGLIGIAGLLACGVGLMVAVPLVQVALALMYVRLSARMSANPAIAPAVA